MEPVGSGIDRRRVPIIVTVATAHFLCTVILLFLVTSSSMADFDAGVPSGVSTALLNGAFKTLCLPLVTPFLWLKIPNTGLWGWLGFLGNSALWGGAVWKVIRVWRAR